MEASSILPLPAPVDVPKANPTVRISKPDSNTQGGLGFGEPPCPSGWSLLRDDSSRYPAGATPEFRLWDDPAGALSVARLGAKAAGRYRLCFNNEITLEAWTRDKLIVDYSDENPDLRATRNHVLADQLFPRILAHGENLVLHAGAFLMSDCCVLIVGASGRGKSSLTASFDQAGYPLIGDDALVVSREDGVSCAKAVYPSLRLFPDSIHALFESSVRTTEVAHYTSKQRIDIPVSADAAIQPKPILAMFMLLEPSAQDTIRLDRLSVAGSCMALLQSSFALDPSDTHRAAQRLEMASALARDVQAFGISYPRTYARLPYVREAILDACMRLKH